MNVVSFPPFSFSKVALNRDKVIVINNRLNVAKAKVDSLIGTKKATQVFSSAKYVYTKCIQNVQHQLHFSVCACVAATIVACEDKTGRGRVASRRSPYTSLLHVRACLCVLN